MNLYLQTTHFVHDVVTWFVPPEARLDARTASRVRGIAKALLSITLVVAVLFVMFLAVRSAPSVIELTLFGASILTPAMAAVMLRYTNHTTLVLLATNVAGILYVGVWSYLSGGIASIATPWLLALFAVLGPFGKTKILPIAFATAVAVLLALYTAPLLGWLPPSVVPAEEIPTLMLLALLSSLLVVTFSTLLVARERDRSKALVRASEARYLALNRQLDQLVAERTTRLHESEQTLRLITETIDDVVWSADAAMSRHSYISPSYERIFGFTLEKPLEDFNSILKAIHPEDRDRIAVNVDGGRQGRAFDHEFRIISANGAVKWIWDRGFPVRADTGQVIRYVGVAQDVTARKRDEQRLRMAIEAGQIVLWELDFKNSGGLIIDPTALPLLGLGRNDDLDNIVKWIARVHPDDRGPFQEHLAQATLPDGPKFSLEYRMHDNAGNLHWIHTTGQVVERLENGQPAIAVGTSTNITERRKSQDARAALEVQLRESQKMEALGTLAGGVAHDFNNIIAAIMGNVELAHQDVGLGHPAMESLEEIRKASRRAKDLVNQILAFGRRQLLARKPISLVPVVQEAARLLRVTLPAGIVLNVQCDPDTPAVLADATQIEQVLLNLCSNAWHAIQGQERPGVIEVRLGPHPQRGARFVALTVRDNGAGMDEATRNRIFEPFFTTKPVGEGTGLGLSVVHGILKEHEASIEVSSAPGEGTTFTILFSETQTPEIIEVTQMPNVSSTHGQGKRVLYVDDDEAIVFLMKRLLERQGYRVRAFTDADEALEAVRARPDEFDLAVTDYNMPGKSGLEVARALREIRDDLPVAMASGYITDELRNEAPAAGVSELIYKPNTVEDLCNAVARLAHSAGGASKPC